ncbi:MAG TPA: hypothetical protein VGU02_16110 [Gaiellaceae bacterium]|nr:hypothetical protein [Gaiellaceae bacterium]
MALTAASLAGTKAFAAAPEPHGSFGDARPGGIEVNLGGGSLREVACARGAQVGARCWVAR